MRYALLVCAAGVRAAGALCGTRWWCRCANSSFGVTTSRRRCRSRPRRAGKWRRFLEHGGNRFGRNAGAGQAGGRAQTDPRCADGGGQPAIRADLATSDFCAIAAQLCQAAPIFRKRMRSDAGDRCAQPRAGGPGPDRGLRRRILLGLPAGGEPTDAACSDAQRMEGETVSLHDRPAAAIAVRRPACSWSRVCKTNG